MAATPSRPWAERFVGRATTTPDFPHRFATVIGIALVLLGPIVAIGWIFDVGMLKSVLAGRPTMKPDTALCLTLLGGALFAQAHDAMRASRTCAGAAAAIGLAHLIEFVAGTDLGVSRLLPIHPASASSLRMSVISATAITALGIALCIDGARRSRFTVLRDACTIVAGLLAIGCVIGHLYEFNALPSLGPVVGAVAIHSAAGLGLASFAVLALATASPLVHIVMAKRAGGRFVRALLPVALLLPFLAGWLRMLGEEADLFSNEIGIVAMVLMSFFGFAAATLLGAARLNAADDDLIDANRTLESTIATRTAELWAVVDQLETQSVFTRGVLDSLSAGLAVLDANGNVVEVNAEWRRFSRGSATGPAGAVIGSSYLDACAHGIGWDREDDARFVHAGIGSVMRRECALFTFDYARKAVDDTRQWFQVRVSPLAAKAGWVVIANHEISAQKSLELELEQSEALLRDTGNMALVGGWELDLATLEMRWTEAVYRIHEIEPVDHPPLERAIEFYGPEARPLVSAAVQAGIERGEPWDLELPFVTATGRALWVRSRGEAVRENGLTVRLHGTFQDITDRRRAEEALRDREASYRLMFEDNPHPMLVYDRVNLQILAVNTATVRRYGWSQAELLAMSVPQLHPPAERNPLLDRVRDLGGGFATGLLWHHVTRHGENLEVEVSSNGVTFEGRPARLVLVHDVTERNRIDRELRAKNAELERFTYTVSHDLKSPLVTVRTFAEYLQDDIATGDSDKVATDLSYISHAAERMALLLDELLQLSRVGNTRNAPVLTSFHEIAREALDMTAGTLSRCGAEVELDPIDVTMHGDRTRLLELWQNLIDNAAKFMGDQPAPRIHVGVAFVGAEPEFFVCDNGIGIDPRHADRVFGLFEKLDTSSGGTGVGLALVRRIVELHGGTIRVESDGVGRGSCFRFTLPETRRSAA